MKIKDAISLNKTDKDRLLVFFEKYNDLFSSIQLKVDNFRTKIDSEIDGLIEAQKANERKLEASILLSEKKIKQQAEMINTKYDTLKFNNYVVALNEKDVATKNLVSVKKSFNDEKAKSDLDFKDYLASMEQKAQESKNSYNLNSTNISQKTARRKKRLSVIYENLVQKENERFLQIEDSLLSKISSIKLNKIEYELNSKQNEELIKGHYNNISLTVNKKIKDESQALISTKETIKNEYEESLLPLEKNRISIEKNFTQTKNDISYRYSNILDEVNKIYDQKKKILEKQRAQIEKRYLESIINETSSDKIETNQLLYNQEIQALEKELSDLREAWVLDIDRRNEIRKLEIGRQEAIYQTNLKKLDEALRNKERQFQISIKNADLSKKLLLLPFEINREFSFKQRNINLQIIENEFEVLILKNEMLCLSTELELELARNTNQYNLSLYKIKFDYLQNRIRLIKQLSIEGFKLKRDHYLSLLEFDKYVTKKKYDLELFKKQFPFNQAQIDNIFVNNSIEQKKLLSDFLIEQERNSTLSQNEGKLNNLSLHRLKEIDNTRINYIRNLIRLLSTRKTEYYNAFLDELRLVPDFFREFYLIFIPLFGYLDKESLLMIRNLYADCCINISNFIKNSHNSLKSNILELSKLDILNENLLKQSYDSFSTLRNEIIISFKEILSSTIKNLELQISSLFKDLEKTKVRINDILLDEKNTTTNRLRDTISLINNELRESSLFNRISSDFGGLELNYDEIVENNDTSYLNQVTIIHQDIFISLDKLVSSVLAFLEGFSSTNTENTHSLKGSYNDGSILVKSLDELLVSFSNKLTNIPDTEYTFLNDTLKVDQGLLINNYNSSKEEFHLYEERMSDLDEKILEYHGIVKEYSSDKLIKNNRDNLNYGTNNFNKSVERKAKEILRLEHLQVDKNSELDRSLNLNNQNLIDSLLFLKRTRDSSLKKLSASLREVDLQTKHDTGLTLDKSRSLLKMANTRIDHQIDQLERTKKEYVEINKKRLKEILIALETAKKDSKNNQEAFKKSLAFEDKKYQTVLRGIEREIKKERL
ncbi:hypothetical protein LJC17_01015 [Acholeplasma sp. OttesenSCG-928-E16]|nr:hypothetical protein [Acholeplasma sp. OttesenSCG-928-E16]